VSGLCFSPDNTAVVSCSGDRTIAIQKVIIVNVIVLFGVLICVSKGGTTNENCQCVVVCDIGVVSGCIIICVCK
jgi:hypothetical protein